jgi:hypothetical protein
MHMANPGMGLHPASTAILVSCKMHYSHSCSLNCLPLTCRCLAPAAPAMRPGSPDTTDTPRSYYKVETVAHVPCKQPATAAQRVQSCQTHKPVRSGWFHAACSVVCSCYLMTQGNPCLHKSCSTMEPYPTVDSHCVVLLRSSLGHQASSDWRICWNASGGSKLVQVSLSVC